MSSIQLITLIVHQYDPAISFFVNCLGFTLIEDKPALTNDGRPKRWVVVQPPGNTPAQTKILLAQADGHEQQSIVGRQFAGRVGLFWQVDDFDATYTQLLKHNFRFMSEPRTEEYGKVAVFLDLAGNRWDLLGPKPQGRVV